MLGIKKKKMWDNGKKCPSAFVYWPTISRTFQEHFDSSVIVLFTKVVLYGFSSGALKGMNLEMQLLRDDFSVLTVQQLLLLLTL